MAYERFMYLALLKKIGEQSSYKWHRISTQFDSIALITFTLRSRFQTNALMFAKITKKKEKHSLPAALSDLLYRLYRKTKKKQCIGELSYRKVS